MAQAHLPVSRPRDRQPGSMPLARMRLFYLLGRQKGNEIAGRGRLRGLGGKARRIDNDVLQFARQRTDQFGARHRKDSDDLLEADLGVARGHEFGHWPTRQLRFRPHLLGKSEPVQQIGDTGAARTMAVGNGARRDQGAFERCDGCDIGLGAPARTASPTVERVISVMPACDLAVAAQIFEFRSRQQRDVEDRAGLDLFLQHRGKAEFDIDLDGMRRSNSGATSTISVRMRAAAEDFEFSPSRNPACHKSAHPIGSLPFRRFSTTWPTKRKGRPRGGLPVIIAMEPRGLFRGGKRHVFDRRLGLDGRFPFALGENERVPLDGDFADLVHHRAGTGRDQVADDGVPFQAVERVAPCR